MNAHFAAAVAFQSPNYARYEPAQGFGKNLCGKCQREVTTYAFMARDGNRIETYHCPTHGDVPPMRSHIVRPESTKCA